MSDEQYKARIELCAKLARYWFDREYHGADYALDPETMQPVMAEEEALGIMREKAVSYWALTDEQLQRMVDVTVRDIMSLSPLRKTMPSQSRMNIPVTVNRSIG